MFFFMRRKTFICRTDKGPFKRINGVTPIDGNVSIPFPRLIQSCKWSATTLSSLQTAFPSDNANIYLITSGGIYQATTIF